MRNIRATDILLTGVFDEFGNAMKPYVNSIITENATQRPIANNSPFNIRRDSESDGTGGLVVDSVGPVITGMTPSAPTNTGSGLNGGLLAKAPETSGPNAGRIVDGEIVLTFDKPVRANSGKSITIRPFGEWAIPPILTISEMDELHNRTRFFDENGVEVSDTLRTTYRRRLQWIDANGLPDLGGRTTLTAFNQRTIYNSYIHTTHGLVSGVGNFVRPDTSGKWVLAFDRDLYTGEGTDLLREVFNAARWKWQSFLVTSGSVQINSNVVTITLPEPLERGRIWEILIEDGAFRDAAGNETTAVTTSTPNYNGGQGLRFWSQGTADPVIRVDRNSHGDNYHGLPVSYRGDWGSSAAMMPKIDVLVRIDSETPGADIRYDTIRTKYTLNPGGTSTNDAFSSMVQTVAFFNHGNVTTGGTNAPPTAAPYANHSIGFSNNVIGNNGNHEVTPRTNVPIILQHGYFPNLLVPIENQTANSAIPVADNGSVPWGTVTARGNALINGINISTSNGLVYRTVANNGAETWGSPVFEVTGNTSATTESANGRFFFVGDAYTTGTGSLANRDATGANDERLFTGRRDYVMAAAQKNEVTTGPAAGPRLNVSFPSYEGVYKTTVLFREPANGLYWLTMQGFDTPMAPSTPGFPLQEYIAMPADHTRIEHLYFSRQAWRVAGIRSAGAASAFLASPEAGTWPTGRVAAANLQANLQATNHHIWVSWDIVSDWYFKGRSLSSSGDFGRLQRAGYNYGAVLATYGSVSYRFRQNFEGGYAPATPSVTQPVITE
jgi:hypothetical protein